LICSGLLRLLSPHYVLSEIKKHKQYVIDESGFSEEGFELILSRLLENIVLVPTVDFEQYVGVALYEMRDIDEFDTAFVACTLATDADGIWSDDKHLSQQTLVRTFTTRELVACFIQK
jgi:predicted nucleic acid-binding protein